MVAAQRVALVASMSTPPSAMPTMSRRAQFHLKAAAPTKATKTPMLSAVFAGDATASRVTMTTSRPTATREAF